MNKDREQGIRDACALIASYGLDTSAFHYALSAMEHFGLKLEPTFKTSMVGEHEVVEIA